MQFKQTFSYLKSSRSRIGTPEIIGLLILLLAIGSNTPRQADAEALPQAVGRQWTDSLCGRCHKVDHNFSHPVNVVPSMAVPSYLPLEKGQITCLTCHEADAGSHAQARTEKHALLRTSRSETAFCAECHHPGDNSRSAQHALALGRAHLSRDGTAVRAGSGYQYDVESTTCLSCHDGLMAPDAGSTVTRMDGLSDDHPIGVSMLSFGQSVDGVGVQSPQSLDPRIRLFNNRVGCGSCHSLFSSEKSLLVMSNRGSRLCLSCHAN